ncbi:transcriptional-regulating factor 1-like [Sphaeramia orbicularis]|uniref:Transcriptional-regulating factor 1-like n=1 Tax=Sphaeramia orbicularis TaxID=375764 RepID=A0A672YLS6_9TELE|nr:transcriptional-regulating factor 1-like [Sphaeramia orbicularis]
MDDCSSTHTYPSHHHHHHHHHPSLHLNLPSLQSPEVDYSPAQPTLDPLQQYGSRGEESISSFTASGASSKGRKGSNGGERGLLNTSGSGLDASLGSHFDGESGHFVDSWYGSGKKEETWDDGESCESAADEFYSKIDCYRNPNDALNNRNCSTDDSVGPRGKANYNSFSHTGYEPKTETTYDIESHFMKQTTSGRFSDGGLDHCRMDSVVRDTYLGREEDYGSSSGSGEDQLQPTEVELSPWLNVSVMNQSGEGRWRGGLQGLASSFPPQRSPVGTNSRTYTQKLDSFSDAFLSQRKRRFPVVPSGDSSGQMWELESIKSRLSCAFDSDSPLPPSSSSPAHPSLPSFPSPPTSSHLMSSVLSPPPTPLPPPSHSPSKMDSPCTLGASAHSQGRETLGTLQFFPSRLQSLPPLHSSGIIWKFPVLPHCFPQSSGDCSSIEDNLRSSHGSDYGNSAAPHDVVQSSESSLLPSPSQRPILHPARTSYPSLHPHPSHSSGSYYMAGGSGVPYMVGQTVRNGPANVSQSQLQRENSPNYTGTPFPSILQSSRGQKRTRYTPRPLLNPFRRGAGLYSSLSSVHHRQDEVVCGEDEEGCAVLPCINVGPDFQADLPPCLTHDGSEVWPSEELPKEQLLWKPWDELTESITSQDQVEKLLSMCNSSCLPGGGSNTELALHCLHSCQGNTMATLEMLLFSKPAPTGDYHYSGTDYWTDNEKSLFGAALETYGKEFPLIHIMVKTKTVRQCVEFYYLSKKLQDKQKKLKEEENRNTEVTEQKRVTPICQPMERQMGLEEAVPVPSLASFFPCKLCGKMFYKIKSRNAHMKIHRQPQEDWTDRRLQQQILTQRLALTRPSNNLMPSGNLLPPQAPVLTFSSSGLAGTSSSNKNANNVISSITSSSNISPSDTSVLDHSTAVTYSNINSANSHVITSIDGADPSQRESGSVLPFQQTWGSYGHNHDPPSFYCSTDAKDRAQTGGGKEPIKWQ